MTATPPPSPAAATDDAEFVAGLRRLRTWSGRSFRQLERHARAAGETLPASTAATMLGRNRLPREELLVTFLVACGLDEDARRPWVAARTALADGTATAAPAAAAPAVRTRGWRLAFAAAALVATFAGGVAFAEGAGETVDVETVTVSR